MSIIEDVPSDFIACTPSDSTVVTGCYGVYVGGAGDLAVRGIGSTSGTTVTLVGVPAGTFVPGRFSRIMAATTATNIVLLY